jgi:hypothetical protein
VPTRRELVLAAILAGLVATCVVRAAVFLGSARLTGILWAGLLGTAGLIPLPRVSVLLIAATALLVGHLPPANAFRGASIGLFAWLSLLAVLPLPAPDSVAGTVALSLVSVLAVLFALWEQSRLAERHRSTL